MNDVPDGQGGIDTLLSIHGNSVDWYLQALVKMATDDDVEMGLTLVVGGSVVSGILISGKKYFDEFARDISSAVPEDGREEVRAAFAGYGSIYDKPAEERSTPHFIHLRNSRVHWPSGQIPSDTGVLWRGRINAVSGFSLGELQVS